MIQIESFIWTHYNKYCKLYDQVHDLIHLATAIIEDFSKSEIHKPELFSERETMT